MALEKTELRDAVIDPCREILIAPRNACTSRAFTRKSRSIFVPIATRLDPEGRALVALFYHGKRIFG